ncbi:hypothetical protein M378DRAFT_456638 [Amanita muscaria Koide BX008]|uniref:Uncharacterized protein n=1 Tax=Amanita muscaria (strain Koide BX008) TaxID=946122 RepID=A0A0C2WV94_AMAMK|nr:hypothetical protein M378DRAFT_456638 [Amanita muscaria Koide BX008]
MNSEDSEDTLSDNADHGSEGVDDDDDSIFRTNQNTLQVKTNGHHKQVERAVRSAGGEWYVTLSSLHHLSSHLAPIADFSLLGHLTSILSHNHPRQLRQYPYLPTQAKSNRTVVAIQLDPTQPLFFSVFGTTNFEQCFLTKPCSALYTLLLGNCPQSKLPEFIPPINSDHHPFLYEKALL